MLIGCGVLGDCGSLDTDGLVAGWMVICIRIVLNVNDYQFVSVNVQLACMCWVCGLYEWKLVYLIAMVFVCVWNVAWMKRSRTSYDKISCDESAHTCVC